ncbi:MAG: anti-sigma factor antagonist [Desulfovibrionaceae bacterium]
MEMDIKQVGTCTVARVMAESIDYTVCDAFKQMALAEVENKEKPCLILNLEKVTFMDSMTIGALVTLKKTITQQGGKFGLCALHPYVVQIVRVVTLNTIFNIYETEEQALADLR